jgi:integrase
VRLDRLAPAHLQGLLADLETTGVGAAMRQVIFRALHRAFAQAVTWGVLARNHAEGIVRPRPARREMQTWSPEQVGRFLAAASGDRLAALYAVLVGTGLRLGEALGLTWADLDLRAGTATIRRQLSEVSGALSFTEPKTAAARRTVDLPAFVVEALREHEARMAAEGRLLNDQLLVFVDTGGRPLRRSNIRRRSFEPLLRRAGLPKIRLHDLRHTAATLHLRNGVHPKIVQQLLGHARVAITLDTYSHAVPGMGREAAARLHDLLRMRGQAP